MTRFGIAGVRSWMQGEPAPDPSLLPTRLRRRTSPLTRVVAGCLRDLAAQTGLDLRTTALVHGSALGELKVTVDLLTALHRDDGLLSPTAFHNSVHNTPMGYVSIATANRDVSTSIAAGESTTAMALLEATCLLQCGTSNVAVIVADEALPDPLGPVPGYPSLVVALHLRREPAQCSIEMPTPEPGEHDAFDDTVAVTPARWAWNLAGRVAQRRGGRVPLAPSPDPWSARLHVQP